MGGKLFRRGAYVVLISILLGMYLFLNSAGVSLGEESIFWTGRYCQATLVGALSTLSVLILFCLGILMMVEFWDY